jgi:hypothetical protein
MQRDLIHSIKVNLSVATNMFNDPPPDWRIFLISILSRCE